MGAYVFAIPVADAGSAVLRSLVTHGAGDAHGGGRSMRTRVAGGVGAVLGMLLLAAPVPANADEPFSIEERITDRVDALGDRRGEVEDAIDRLFEDHRLDLYVVYVDNFSGMSRDEWADETAQRSQLGINDALLAVATGERAYQLSIDPDYPLPDAQLREIQTVAIEPPLRANDWAGGAIGAANGLAASLSGQEVQTPEIVPGEEAPSADGGFPWAPVILVGAGAAGVGGYAYYRSRRRAAATADSSAPTLDELDARASSLLVETDDAVKTSEQELGFATAQFGEEAAAPFAKAIDEARADLAASFRLRQQLDDAVPEDDATRRRMLDEIITRCEAANESLDAEADAFDRLRDLEQNAPQVLAEVERRAAELGPDVAALSGALDELRSRYAESALESVKSNDEQASERLDFIATAAGDARRRLDSGDSAAAVAVLAAQEAVGQAAQLVEAVNRLRADLDQAGEGLRRAVQQTTQDLTAAKALLGGGQPSPDLASRVASAEYALTAVQRELARGRFDPLAATERIELAQQELSAALQGVRDEQARKERARAVLDQTMLAARSEISAIQDFITTRRSGVGSEARTRLAEAQRHLEQAMALARHGDSEAALQEAQHARQLATQAGQLARNDVGAMVGEGGLFGGGSPGGGLAGAILGGILIDSMLGGGRAGRGGGGFGGGFGGSRSWGGGSRGPGSFGGRGTRARRGGGGRF